MHVCDFYGARVFVCQSVLNVVAPRPGSVLMRMLLVMGPAGAGFVKRVADPTIARAIGRRLEVPPPTPLTRFESGPPAFSAFVRRALVWEHRPSADQLLRDEPFLCDE